MLDVEKTLGDLAASIAKRNAEARHQSAKVSSAIIAAMQDDTSEKLNEIIESLENAGTDDNDRSTSGNVATASGPARENEPVDQP